MSSMRFMTYGLAGLGLLAGAAPARADRAALDANRTGKFRELDRDGNGSLTRDEYGGHPGNFRALDQNKDGVLSLDEFVNRQDVRPEEQESAAPLKRDVPIYPVVPNDLFAAKDHDGNGVVDRAEWPDAREFTRRDTNRDDRISRQEYFAFEPGGAAAGDDRVSRFDRLDRNGDGVVSRTEWKGGSRTFERTDYDGDGVISRSEYLR
jgi:Ca2+-binding EF-hand superfamily protein